MKYTIFQVDSFTKEKFSGNPAGVVLNADGLNELQMQQIAREFNNSETAFILQSNSPDYDIEVKFFTPTREVPICGHATIAAHYIYARENKLNNTQIIQKTGAGILPVDIRKINEDYKITMTQAEIKFGNKIENKNRQLLLEALNITENELYDDLPIQIISTGHSKVIIGIKNKAVLDNLKPDTKNLTDLSTNIKCNGYYVFTFDTRENDILTSGRMFAPAIGIQEDPVTGNANGPLGAYLVKYGKLETNNKIVTFTAKQGEAIKRKGFVEVTVEGYDKNPEKVKVTGNAVIVFKAEIEI